MVLIGGDGRRRIEDGVVKGYVGCEVWTGWEVLKMEAEIKEGTCFF